ncbi:DUF484 family protein [Paludibacterium purpuratum]|uniref:DUF484 family protein n=1 Tax=Paludibacterium purpuratum TaxID=1144873 RepID=A0A4R7AYK8_9NEIS|nr:DUF484 family protein [Paludibacterium purpuratum]TDR71655.1 hypothetical protein DFP86_11867 [Paludibacterium purpuratum]
MSEHNATMQSDDVLAFLENHPDFLQHHADRFGLKHGGDRVVVSLVDRQMLELKDRCRQLEARLQQLVRHGENNDQIQARMHRLALTLLKADTPARLAGELRTGFAEIFGLDRMALRLWHPAAESLGELFNARGEVSLLARNLNTPYCGPYVNDEVMSWFPAVPVLQSFCQVALRDAASEPFGLLVLASDDPQRFTHDMHTHYLVQIGELIGAAWSRLLGPA